MVGTYVHDACAQQQFQSRPQFRSGQVIQPSVVPTQNYQGQTQVIQQALPTLPVYQDRGIIVPNQTAPPIVRTAPQPVVDKNFRKALEAEKAAYREAQLEVKKLAEKNAALIRQNEGAMANFKSLEKENQLLTQKVGVLGEANDRFQETVGKLRKKLAAAGQDSGGMQDVEKMKKNLKTQVETLSSENESFRTKITSLTADLAAAQEKAMQAKPDDGNEAKLQQLTEDKRVLTEDKRVLIEEKRILNQNHQQLTQEYQTLNEKNQSVLSNNQTLSAQIAELSSSNQGYQSDIASLQAKASELSGQLSAEETVEPMAAQPTVDVGAFQSKINQLTRKNRQLAQSNADFEERNKSLGLQLASLQGQSAEVDTPVTGTIDTVDVAEGIQGTLAAAVPAAVPAAGDGYGIMTWMIPFLVLGLGIAFFVIVREELHRPST